jgi:hypothetical protein
MGKANTIQEHFVRVFDDGSESGSTLGTADANWTQDVDTIFRARFCPAETGGGSEVRAYELRYSIGGAYLLVTGSTPIQVTSSAETSWTITDGDPTTDRLSGSGSFVAGEYSEDGSTAAVTLVSQYSNVEYCLTIDSAQVADEDTITLRVYFAGGTALDSYSVTPTITVNDTTLSISETDSAAPSDTATVDPIALPINESDALTVVDIVRYYADAVVLGESTSVTVVSEGPATLTISEADAVSLGEAVTVDPLLLEGISETDSAAPSDSANLEQAHHVSEADSAAPGEAQTVRLQLGDIVEADSAAPSESQNLEQAHSIAETDSATPSEAQAVELIRLVSEADSAAPADSINLELAYHVSEADAVGLGESTTVTVSDLLISETDAVTLGESTDVSLVSGDTLTVSVADSATPSEAQAVELTIEVVETDSATPGEAQTVQLVNLISEADSAALGEATTVTVSDLLVAEIDTISLTDSATVSIGVLGDLSVNVSDSAAPSEATTITPLVLPVSEADAITPADSAAVDPLVLAGISEVDAVSLTDSATADLLLFPSASDAVSVADVASITPLVIDLSTAEAVSLGELSVVALPGYIITGAPDNVAYVLYVEQRSAVRYEERRAEVRFEDHRAEV